MVRRGSFTAQACDLNLRDLQLDMCNSNFFLKVAEEKIAEGTIGTCVACYFNMKRFSVVNNQLGREMGTAMLKLFLSGLEDRLQENGIVCRVSEDNFVMLFEAELLDTVRQYLNGTAIETEKNSVKKIYLSAHAGYYVIPPECQSASDIMDRTSMAFVSAKYVQKEPYVFFDEQIMQEVENTKIVEGSFADAIENEEFLVYYQPKVCLKNYRLEGAEALCRWKHNGEMIQPFRFIPVLEQSHLICLLDFYMLEHVCRDISRWLKEGKPVVRVSVNLSRAHLGDVELLEHILEIVDRYRVPHEYIEIELTETTMDVDYKELKSVVTGLRNQGISVAVDDFGVGYSSLNLIREMSWKVLKIDRTFLQTKDGEDAEQQKGIMLKHIVAMAQHLGLECIAEGVETVEQVTMLKENNCYMAQGYLFDPPLPVDKYEKRLEGLLN